jgi:hypothetical protein
MINIDQGTGIVKIGCFSFSKGTEMAYLNSQIFSSSKVEMWSSKGIWKSYRFFENNLIFVLRFNYSLLEIIEIYPLEKKEDITALDIIIQLGGAHEYSWGNIELNNDKKAGYESVLIRYF